MALSLFPYLLVAAKEAEGEKKEVLILTATSGDTGKAALKALKMCLVHISKYSTQQMA